MCCVSGAGNRADRRYDRSFRDREPILLPVQPYIGKHNTDRGSKVRYRFYSYTFKYELLYAQLDMFKLWNV